MATAIGILIAIPAVAAFNAFQRVVRGTVANTDALGHVLLAHLKATPLAAGAGADASGAERSSGDTRAKGAAEDSERN